MRVYVQANVNAYKHPMRTCVRTCARTHARACVHACMRACEPVGGEVGAGVLVGAMGDVIVTAKPDEVIDESDVNLRRAVLDSTSNAVAGRLVPE